MEKGSPEKKKASVRVWLVPVIILAASLAAALIVYPFLPSMIPYHFNLDGTQSSYASKGFIFLAALIPAVLYLAIRAKYGRK